MRQCHEVDDEIVGEAMRLLVVDLDKQELGSEVVCQKDAILCAAIGT